MKLFKPVGAKKWHMFEGNGRHTAWFDSLCQRAVYVEHLDKLSDSDDIADSDICTTCKQAASHAAR